MGFVFQAYALFEHLTVWGNVLYGLRGLRGEEKEAGVRRAAELMARFGIGHLRDRFPAQLSGGQRQRAALIRALVRHPAVLLLDQPLAALDRGLREQLRQEIKELPAEWRIPVVLVTHCCCEERLATRVLRPVRSGGTVGICLGSQLIARAFGAEVKPNPVKEIGWYPVRLTPEGEAAPLLPVCRGSLRSSSGTVTPSRSRRARCSWRRVRPAPTRPSYTGVRVGAPVPCRSDPGNGGELGQDLCGRACGVSRSWRGGGAGAGNRPALGGGAATAGAFPGQPASGLAG